MMREPSTADAAESYTAVAKLLHWSIALFVVALVALGLTMTLDSLPLDRKFQLYQLHKSLGFTVLALMLVRIVWRLTHKPPELPATVSSLERRGAQLAHLGLYLLLIVMPLSGWALVSAASFQLPTVWFGLVTIPHLPILGDLPMAARPAYEGAFAMLHAYLGYALVGLVTLHVLAALRHHFVLKDGVLAGMLPAGRRRLGIGLVIGLLALGSTLMGRGPAEAAELAQWTIDKAQSTVGFEVKAGGQPMSGAIGAYEGRIGFDPGAPEVVDIAMELDLASLTTGNPQADQILAEPAWLDPASHRMARFVATKAAGAGSGAYVLDGTLTLKGVERPLQIPFTLVETNPGEAKVTARFVIDRKAHGIGGGMADPAVAPEIEVSLELVAKKG